MLSVRVHKDVAEYQPKIFGKMTGRTLVCIAGAVGITVASTFYFQAVLGLPDNGVVSMISYATGLPFWAAGFWRPKGMKFEQALPLYLNHKLTNNRIYLTTKTRFQGLVEDLDERGKIADESASKNWRRIKRQRGIESWCPGEE